jgi:threonine dehydrogenase-like Zn-dependent dehydrogenase
MVADQAADPEHGWVEVYEIMRAVPRTISVEDALMLCMWREVYAAFDDFQLQKGDDIVIFGAGPVGLSFVKFARILGLGFIACVEPVVEKHKKALEMGADVAISPDEASLGQLKHAHGGPFDALIDAVGREAIINASLPLVKLGGSVCVYGVIDTPEIRVEKHKGPYNFNLLIHQWPTREREAAAQEPLVKWIEAGKLSYREFVAADYPIQEIQRAYEGSKTGLPIKTILRF